MKKYKFCFIHIEKAAGSTIHNWLKYYIPNYLSLSPVYEWTNEKESEFSKKELSILKLFHPFLAGIGGHRLRSFLNYESLFGGDLVYFTFLRSPIPRYLSHFEHQRDVMHNKRSFDDFLEEKRFNNFMCVKICGKEDGNLAFNVLKDNFGFVGFVENFNRSLLILSKILSHKKLIPLYEKKNQAKSKGQFSFENLSTSQKAKLIQNTNQDIILYKLALSYFSNYYERLLNEDFENELSSLNNTLVDFRYDRFRKFIVKIFKGYNHFITEPISRLLIKLTN